MSELVTFTLPEALKWTTWRPLQGSWNDRSLPEQAGLYRIRRWNLDVLDYVGQTGRFLRQRLGDLRGVYSSEMPYQAPHTVGPALWALRHGSAYEFEVSVAAVVGSEPYRKGLEALVIAQYRQEKHVSPTFNFGRMPNGYRMSSSNNRQLAEQGRRFHGGPHIESNASHLSGLPPTGPIGEAWHDQWYGLPWSAWCPSAEVLKRVPATTRGVYLLRGINSGVILYIGQGKVQSRILQHESKQFRSGHPQGEVFKAHGGLEVAYTPLLSVAQHQLLEIENDLIAAFLLTQNQVPAAQFLGDGSTAQQRIRQPVVTKPPLNNTHNPKSSAREQ